MHTTGTSPIVHGITANCYLNFLALRKSSLVGKKEVIHWIAISIAIW